LEYETLSADEIRRVINGERIVRENSSSGPASEEPRPPGRRSSVPPSGRPSGLEPERSRAASIRLKIGSSLTRFVDVYLAGLSMPLRLVVSGGCHAGLGRDDAQAFWKLTASAGPQSRAE